jgi:hypothetical protein
MDGNNTLRRALANLSTNLTAVVARCAIWASPEVVMALRLEPENQDARWWYNCRRAKGQEGKPGTFVDGVCLDNNMRAGSCIKRVCRMENHLGHSNWTACHIWAKSCYDPRYHTSIPNLILLPAALADLTDFYGPTIAALRYRSYELYDWYAWDNPPRKPGGYDKLIWRNPVPCGTKVQYSISHRNPIIA